MTKTTIFIGENKDADQLRKADFATWKVQSHFFLNPKFQASSCLLWGYSPVCVGPVQKPHCWFSYEAAILPAAQGVSEHPSLSDSQNCPS